MWPVHTWLPDATSRRRPAFGDLAAIMPRWRLRLPALSLPIAPDASRELDWLIIGLS